MGRDFSAEFSEICSLVPPNPIDGTEQPQHIEGNLTGCYEPSKHQSKYNSIVSVL